MSTDTIVAVLTGVQSLVVALTVLYLARQVNDQRDAIDFQVYSQVSDAYARHLWMAVDRPQLDDVWEPFTDEDRLRELQRAQEEAERWGAWHAMTMHERVAYRWTRGALEIFEQAWQLRDRGQISDETWTKWRGWMAIWKTTRYYEFVFDDTRARLLGGFCRELTALREPDAGSRPASSPPGPLRDRLARRRLAGRRAA